MHHPVEKVERGGGHRGNLGRRSRWVRVRRCVGALLAGGSVVWLARTVSVTQVLHLVQQVGPRLGWLPVPYLLATTVAALPWAMLMEVPVPSWWALVASRFGTAAVNVLLPSGVAGEPLRLRIVPSETRHHAAERLLWDRATYAAATALLLAAGAGTAWGRTAVLTAPLGLAAGGYTAGAAGLVGLTRVPWLRRWWSRRLGGTGDLSIRSRWPSRGRVAGAVGVHLLGRTILVGELWLGARWLGLGWGPGSSLLAGAVVALGAAVFPYVPGQLGVQEASFAALSQALGTDPGGGVALALLVRLRQLVCVPVGLLWGSGATHGMKTPGPVATVAAADDQPSFARSPPVSDESKPKKHMTRQGHDKFSAELDHLWKVERRRVVDEVETAAAHGDRSENAEYQYGKRRLREIDRRIEFLGKLLKDVVVVDPARLRCDKAYFGSWVTIEDEDGERRTYQIVSRDETDPSAGRVSTDSPLGRALWSRRPGDVVTWRRPAGDTELEIVAIDNKPPA